MSTNLWTDKEIKLVVERTVSLIQESHAIEITTYGVIHKLKLAQQLTLPTDRHRKFDNLTTLARTPSLGEPIAQKLVEAGWMALGTKWIYRSQQPSKLKELELKLQTPPSTAAPSDDSDDAVEVVKTGEPQELSAVIGLFSSILERLSRLEELVAAGTESGKTAEQLARVEGNVENTVEFDELIVNELDQVRATVENLARGIKEELPPTLRTPVIKQGPKVVRVTVIGLRERDEAVINTRMRKLNDGPGMDNIEVRFVQATRSPHSINTDYALVMRWVSHAWFEHAKMSVRDKSNCIFLSHSGVTLLLSEIRKIAAFEAAR